MVGGIPGTEFQNKPCSFHRTIKNNYTDKENYKIIGGGHVYILNYNSETFNEKKPITFDEYLKMKQRDVSYNE